jgi:hypothetical protein
MFFTLHLCKVIMANDEPLRVFWQATLGNRYLRRVSVPDPQREIKSFFHVDLSLKSKLF